MIERLTGWGRTSPSWSRTQRCTPEEIDGLWDQTHPHGILVRGGGRSYGDAAQNSDGLVLSVDADTIDGDLATGIVRIGSKVTFGQLIGWALPHGWFPPVVPGTRHVTIGGAIAADVHGKNHTQHGSIGRHLLRIGMYTPTTGPVDAVPGTDLFAATLGGMGLTGIVTDVDLRLRRVETGLMHVRTTRTDGLDDVLRRLHDTTAAYAVAWLDLSTDGCALGRGAMTVADHSGLDSLDRGQERRLRYDHSTLISAGRLPPLPLVNRWTVRALHAYSYRRIPARTREATQTISGFFHPLDRIDQWNLLHGPRGFHQYQFVVPDRAVGVVEQVARALAARRTPVAVAVLKRFGERGDGLLSFPIPGWTLAVDVPAHDDVVALLRRCNDDVAAAGGRVYLAKDSFLQRQHLETMYPDLVRWREVRNAYDEAGRLVSDLDRRLDLSGRHERDPVP